MENCLQISFKNSVKRIDKMDFENRLFPKTTTLIFTFLVCFAALYSQNDKVRQVKLYNDSINPIFFQLELSDRTLFATPDGLLITYSTTNDSILNRKLNLFTIDNIGYNNDKNEIYLAGSDVNSSNFQIRTYDINLNIKDTIETKSATTEIYADSTVFIFGNIDGEIIVKVGFSMSKFQISKTSYAKYIERLSATELRTVLFDGSILVLNFKTGKTKGIRQENIDVVYSVKKNKDHYLFTGQKNYYLKDKNFNTIHSFPSLNTVCTFASEENKLIIANQDSCYSVKLSMDSTKYIFSKKICWHKSERQISDKLMVPNYNLSLIRIQKGKTINSQYFSNITALNLSNRSLLLARSNAKIELFNDNGKLQHQWQIDSNDYLRIISSDATGNAFMGNSGRGLYYYFYRKGKYFSNLGIVYTIEFTGDIIFAEKDYIF